jgi:gamma-glutamyltranspeptidase/glutathione hydrolase
MRIASTIVVSRFSPHDRQPSEIGRGRRRGQAMIIEPSPTAPLGIPAHRPLVTGSRHLVSAGHYGAAHAAFAVLEAGGNAVDAGVAGGIALGVLQSDIVNVAGVAPILVYLAERDEVVSVAGLGTWPKAASAAFFREHHGGLIPKGLWRTVVPAAPAAWIEVLQRYGSMSFGEVAGAAIRFAREGFAMHPLMAEVIASHEEDYRRWPSTAAIYLPGGKLPKVGDLFVQEDLGKSLQYMVDQEKAAASKGRRAGLQAARDAFYKGDIAATITRYHAANEGWLDMADMAGFEVPVEAAVSVRYKGREVYTCPAWCQGPFFAEALKIVEGIDVRGLGHNSTAYAHALVEALRIAFADRERWLGDPRFVDVPLARLLSDAYAAERRASIDPRRAHAGMPPASDGRAALEASRGHLDTSYLCVVDRHGNVFSATPSDTSSDSPVIPGTGLVPSMRGSQSWTDPAHPSVLAPGKRPRLTPNPALVLGRKGPKGREVLPFGTPGGDVQIQAMLQTFLNIVEFGMSTQQAVEAPRFATYSHPDSFQPHGHPPHRLEIEARIEPSVAAGLAEKGHNVQSWPQYTWKAGAMCVIHKDPDTGLMTAGADPRRACYALGW